MKQNEGFYEIYRTLILTGLYHGPDSVMLTSIDYETQKHPDAVEFDYSKVYDREDEYNDIAGFYHTHPSGMNRMSSIDIETMRQWVITFGKPLFCLIETSEKLNVWFFTKKGEHVIYEEMNARTNNGGVNFVVWRSRNEKRSDQENNRGPSSK